MDRLMMIIREDDLKYLREAGCSDEVVRHCRAVAEKAMEIAEKIQICVDEALIREGAILHDIGRAETHEIDHAVRGAEIAKQMGIHERAISIIERHIGAGIPADEAAGLGLPLKDYIPHTPEEIIVAYADNLVRGEIIVPFEKALASFRESLGENHPAIERFIRMHETVQSWMD
jgi:uncharacterized protein